MCRNIRTLFNFAPPASELEIRDASLQFVRKLSGFNVPSKANQAAFDRAVLEVAAATRTLMQSLVTSAEPRDARGRGAEGPRACGAALRRARVTGCRPHRVVVQRRVDQARGRTPRDHSRYTRRAVPLKSNSRCVAEAPAASRLKAFHSTA